MRELIKRNKKFIGMPRNREFKKLRRLLQRKDHFKMELYVRLNVLRLFHVGYVVQNRRSALSLAWHIAFGFHVKAKNDRFTAASSRCRQNLKFENFTSSFGRQRQNIARAARLFFFIQSIKSLIGGVVVDFAVVKS